MTWKTHMAGGMAAGTGAVALIQNIGGIDMTAIQNIVPIVIISGISALLADVDEKESKAGQVLLPVSMVFWLLQSIIKILSLFTFGNLRKRIRSNTQFVMHRGICHYPITLAVLFVIGLMAIVILSGDGKWYLILMAFTVGYFSHILLDLISGKIALFFPISKKRIGIRLFKYNGIGEKILVLPALIIATVIMMAKIVRF